MVLVFFIGGCTLAEVKYAILKLEEFFVMNVLQISALRFLSQQEDSNVEFVIATTKLINGDNFLKSIIEA